MPVSHGSGTRCGFRVKERILITRRLWRDGAADLICTIFGLYHYTFRTAAVLEHLSYDVAEIRDTRPVKK
jgi:hypothetical protein